MFTDVRAIANGRNSLNFIGPNDHHVHCQSPAVLQPTIKRRYSWAHRMKLLPQPVTCRDTMMSQTEIVSLHREWETSPNRDGTITCTDGWMDVRSHQESSNGAITCKDGSISNVHGVTLSTSPEVVADMKAAMM